MVRIGGRRKGFVFLTSFLEIEGESPPIVANSTFPFRKIDYAGRVGRCTVRRWVGAWSRLPRLAPVGERFDYLLLLEGVILWVQLGLVHRERECIGV